jgi:hypothetical protein
MNADNIIHTYGVPYSMRTKMSKYIATYPAGETAINEGLSGATNILVKEMYYRLSSGEQFFWLTNAHDKIWKVFYDMHIDKGFML